MIFIEISWSLTLMWSMWSYTKFYDIPSVLIYVWWLLVNQPNTDDIQMMTHPLTVPSSARGRGSTWHYWFLHDHLLANVPFSWIYLILDMIHNSSLKPSKCFWFNHSWTYINGKKNPRKKSKITAPKVYYCIYIWF